MTKLEEKRRKENFTQAFMAESINVSLGCYSMYENNQRKIPREKAELLAKILKCEISDIFIPSNFTNCEIGET